MNIYALLFVGLLVACSGGSRETWSANIASTHSHFLGEWRGTARSGRTGAQVQLELSITNQSTSSPSTFEALYSFSGACAQSGLFGTIRASGFEMQLLSGVARFEGIATEISPDVYRVHGTYAVQSGPCAGDYGEVTITQVPPSPALLNVRGEHVRGDSYDLLMIECVRR
jgi:hypothetical protein